MYQPQVPAAIPKATPSLQWAGHIHVDPRKKLEEELRIRGVSVVKTCAVPGVNYVEG